MKQRTQGVQILRTNTNAIIFGLTMLAIMPVFCALLISTGASALSLPGLVKDITAPVLDILPGKSAPAQPAPISTSTHSDSQQAAPAASNAASSTTGTTTNTSQLAESGAPLEPMPTLNQDLQQ